MNTMYIPKGTTIIYESVETEHLVINGCLKVNGDVKAKQITGKGILHCTSVSADIIVADEVEATIIICKRLICKRVMAPEVFASESAAVSCYLTSSYVETGKLTVALSEVNEVKAAEVVHLSRKKRSLLGTLFASLLRSWWTALVAAPMTAEAVDADYRPDEKDAPAEDSCEQKIPLSKGAVQLNALGDPELTRFVTMFELCRHEGCTLKVIPGTPEENAPILDFNKEHAMSKAA